MSGTVSIIIPCYNAGPFLRETLDSTRRQSHPPLEVFVVDDGSTDDSPQIAQSFGEPVRVMRQANQGESVAMNAALAAARGDYVVFLGADDVLAPNLLEEQLRALDGRRDAVACTGFAFFFDDTSKAFQPHMPHATAFYPGVISANLAPASCWMTPRELILQAGCYYGPQQYFEDWDLWWRVGLTGAALIPVPIIGFYYRQHRGSQLATVRNADRAYGHAWLMERMCRALLDRDDLLQLHGDKLFWSASSALRACRAFDVSWEKLRLLTNMLEEIVRRDPPGLRSSQFARTVRWLGFRRAESISRLMHGRIEAPVYRAPWMSQLPKSDVPSPAGG